LQARRSADHAGRGLHVLAADGGHHIARREAVVRDLLRIEPDAHRVVARAEKLNVADPVDPREAVLHDEHRVVAKVGHVVATVRRQQVHDHRQVGRTLHGGDAEAAHFFGQPRFGARHAVLHELLRLVGVGAELEGDGERHQAVGCRLARHVAHAFDAVDLFLDRRGDRLGDHLGVRARVVGPHDDRGRHDIGVFRDRQPAHRDQATEKDQQREHTGEDRSIDEEFR